MTFIAMDVSEKGEVVFLADTYVHNIYNPYRREPDQIKVHTIAPGVIYGGAGLVHPAELEFLEYALEVAFEKERILHHLEECIDYPITDQIEYAFGISDGTVYHAKNRKLEQKPFVMIGAIFPEVVAQYEAERKTGDDVILMLTRAYISTMRILQDKELPPIGGEQWGRLDKISGRIVGL